MLTHPAPRGSTAGNRTSGINTGLMQQQAAGLHRCECRGGRPSVWEAIYLQQALSFCLNAEDKDSSDHQHEHHR